MEKKEEECDDCNFTVGVKMTESLCNILGKEEKGKCEEIIQEIKESNLSFGDGLKKIKDKFERSIEFVDEIKKIAKEKGILHGFAKPKQD